MVPKVKPAEARAAALVIVRRLRDAGHIAYFAGGCVRDELLGLAPTDYDIATDAVPDRIRALFRRTAEVGASFGVVLVTPQREEGVSTPVTVEVATFRADGPYTDRRRPDVVHFSDPASDAHRRDFTINALFLDPISGDSAENTPRIIDFVGGQQDLEGRTLRAVGDPDARLAEDHLRALRAVRLAARLDFQIEPRTAAAIRQHARQLEGVSRERIGEEIRRMLLHPSRGRAAQLLVELDLLQPVLGQPHTAAPGALLALLPPETASATCLAAWAIEHGRGTAEADIEAVTDQFRRALCLSNDDRDALAATLRNLLQLRGPWFDLPQAAQKRLAGAAGPGFAGALTLLAALDPQRADQVAARVRELEATPTGLRPAPLLTGDDLIALGFRPGPGFKGTLDRVYDAQLEGRIKTHQEAVELARLLGV